MKHFAVFTLFSIFSIAVYAHRHSGEDCDEDFSSSEGLEVYRPRHHRHNHNKQPDRQPTSYVCPDGWQSFDRVLTKWCINVYGLTIDREGAEGLCNLHNATLTGVESENERNIISQLGLDIIRDAGTNIGSIWIGAKRVDACLTSNSNATGCVPWANNAYDWTDGYTTGKSAFLWRPKQPDYLDQAEPCVYLHVVDGQLPSFVTAGAVSGSMDDIQCGAGKSNPLQFVRGYACGRLPIPIY